MRLIQLFKENPFALILLLSIIFAIITFIILSVTFDCQYTICYHVPDSFDILTYFAGYAIALTAIYGVYKLIRSIFVKEDDEETDF